ncbi:hypothetical protein OsJ_25187 [Oryza sativa Japonica Group]|uniref:SKP1 component POZ domain-containing protein n=2 Tax=Oryza sativa subsp. japonica TaxID=39947 RepID=B9FUB4_ORYSJ|nr:hypothetical protein OsJ_25187 [Oryza sativa Japonica Group]
MITLKSSDGEPVEVTEASARISKVIGDKIDAGRGGEAIPLPHVDKKTLKKVIEYCDEHANENSDTDEQKEELKNWDKAFIDELDEDDGSFLFLVLLASSYLKIDGLLDLTYQRVADNSKAKTTEEIRKTFSTIEIELSDKEEEEQQQEEEIRPENMKKKTATAMMIVTPRPTVTTVPVAGEEVAGGTTTTTPGLIKTGDAGIETTTIGMNGDETLGVAAANNVRLIKTTAVNAHAPRASATGEGTVTMAAGVITLVPPTWTTSPILSTPSHTWQRSLCLPASRSFTPRFAYFDCCMLCTLPRSRCRKSRRDQLLRLALVADKAMAAPPPTAMEDLAIRSSTGTEAWFSGTAWKPVPVARVFGRIREALPATPAVETPTTYQQIEEALMRLELAAAAARTPGDDTLLPQPMSPAPLAASPPRRLEDLASDAVADKILPAPLPGALLPQEMTHMPATPPLSALEPGSLPERASSPCAIAGLFTSPPPAIIASPLRSTLPCLRPVVLTRKVKLRPRQHSQAIRRSEHLAKQPARPMMERCQRILFRRLGILHDEEDASVERVLSQYMAMFDGPLPPHAIAALTAIFGLDDDDECAMDASLLPLVGEGITDVADEVEETLA